MSMASYVPSPTEMSNLRSYFGTFKLSSFMDLPVRIINILFKTHIHTHTNTHTHIHTHIYVYIRI